MEIAQQTKEFVETEFLSEIRMEIETIAKRHPESYPDFLRLIGRVAASGQRVEAFVRGVAEIPEDVWNEAVRTGKH